MKNRIGLLLLLMITFVKPQAQELEGGYFIQLAASRTQVSVTEIQKRHSLEDSVIMILQDEWYKYLLGPYDSYELAYTDMKDRGIEGFVTRYENLSVSPEQEPQRAVSETEVDQLNAEIKEKAPEKPILPPGIILKPLPSLHEKLIHGSLGPALAPPHSFLHQAGNAGAFTDERDNSTYRWIRLGDQIWMTDNMHLQMEGARIPSFDSLLPPDYGFLYSAYAASQACPAGWHLPDDAEWMELEHFLGLQSSEIRSIGMRESGHLGLVLKSRDRWVVDGMGVDSYGFRIFPAGWVSLKGSSKELHEKAYYWTASRAMIGMWIRYFDADFHGIGRTLSSPNKYLSVRCIRNQ